jgi:membrane protease YdiL (CAAX protease family)
VNRLKFTFKAWPVIAAATIGLCFLTQGVAKLFGIDLPDQQNIEVVRSWLTHAFESLRHFLNCASLLAQVLVLLPVIEEFVFRWLLFMLPVRKIAKRTARVPILMLSSVLFSAAHYLVQPFPDAAFIALFFFGLAQCWLYWKTNRIWCPMLNHALFNLTNLVLLFVVPS